MINPVMAARGDNCTRLVDFKDILRDIYDSEDMKIQSDRCKKILVTIEGLCSTENADFCATYKEVCKEIQKKRRETLTAKQNLFQAAYFFQVERLPAVLQRLGTEEEGSKNDIILWQVC